MKKILICVLAISLFMSFSAFADINVSVTDAKNNTLNVKGEAPKGAEVMLVILNNGKSEADVVNGSDNAVLYIRTQTADDDGYSFDFKLNQKTGGENFKAIVSVDGTNETKEFVFYPDAYKSEFISSIQSGDISAETAEKALGCFGMSEDRLLDGLKSEDIAKTLESLRAEGNGFPKNSDDFTQILKLALVLSAYNAGGDVFNDDGSFKYSDILGIDSTEEYKDYEYINDEGKSYVRSALIKKDLKTKKSFLSAFKDAVHLQVIVNYNQLGSGHVKTYLQKYENDYSAAGFKMSQFKSYSDKQAVYSELASSKAESLSKLAEVFNAKLSTGSRSGGGGSAVSTGSSTPVGYIQKETQNTGDGNDEPEINISFTDVPDDFWAAEYINKLVKKGILCGRGDNIFAPFDAVSRN